LIDVPSLSTSGEHDDVGRMTLDSSGRQMASYDSTRPSLNDHNVQHLRASVHRDGACGDLFLERLVGPQQQLLAGLTTRVKGSLNLHTAKRAGVEQTAVLPCKWNALGHALVDDVVNPDEETLAPMSALTPSTVK
jgi:hypothetical protein